MEINKYTDIIGVVACDNIVEGRMVLLTNPATTVGTGHDFGSRLDLMGVKAPGNPTEALKAKYVISWPVSNAQATDQIKMMVPMPSFSFALRAGGWDQASNVPFNTTVYLTYPGNQNSVTIPSGYLALAFDRGVFTAPSGQFTYSASLVPGAPLAVRDAFTHGTSEAGKLMYSATGTIAVVERYDSADGSLTFRTL